MKDTFTPKVLSKRAFQILIYLTNYFNHNMHIISFYLFLLYSDHLVINDNLLVDFYPMQVKFLIFKY